MNFLKFRNEKKTFSSLGNKIVFYPKKNMHVSKIFFM